MLGLPQAAAAVAAASRIVAVMLNNARSGLSAVET